MITAEKTIDNRINIINDELVGDDKYIIQLSGADAIRLAYIIKELLIG